MIRTFRYAYILAKIYGSLAKTYVGANFQDLLRLKRLEEIFDQLFPGSGLRRRRRLSPRSWRRAS